MYVNCGLDSYKNDTFVYILSGNSAWKLDSGVECSFSGFSLCNIRVLHIFFFFFFRLLTSTLFFERESKMLCKGFKNTY